MNKVGIFVEGGIGKHIAFSSLLPKLKEKYGELVLVSAYPEVFTFNPFVFRNFGFGQPYLYQDYLKDIPIIKQEPYLSNIYRLDKKHLIEVYCKLYNVEYDVHMQSQVFLDKNEIFQCAEIVKQKLGNKFIMVQFIGGTSYYSPQQAQVKQNDYRDYQYGQKFVDEFRSAYPEYKILQVRLPTEPQLQNVEFISNVSARMIFPFMTYCKTFVVIDSFINHLSNAFNKKGIVLWGQTDPKKLGYVHNMNLTNKGCSMLHCHRPETYFYDNENGVSWKCPNDNSCMNISVDDIMKELQHLMQEQKEENDATDTIHRCSQ